MLRLLCSWCDQLTGWPVRRIEALVIDGRASVCGSGPSSVGQPRLWRTIAIVALPSTTCSGTALQCVQVNTAATVSVCIGSPKQHHAAAPDLVRFHKFDGFPSLNLRGDRRA